MGKNERRKASALDDLCVESVARIIFNIIEMMLEVHVVGIYIVV